MICKSHPCIHRQIGGCSLVLQDLDFSGWNQAVPTINHIVKQLPIAFVNLKCALTSHSVNLCHYTALLISPRGPQSNVHKHSQRHFTIHSYIAITQNSTNPYWCDMLNSFNKRLYSPKLLFQHGKESFKFQ